MPKNANAPPPPDDDELTRAPQVPPRIPGHRTLLRHPEAHVRLRGRNLSRDTQAGQGSRARRYFQEGRGVVVEMPLTL